MPVTGCGHCKKMKPAFGEAAKMVHDEEVGNLSFHCSDITGLSFVLWKASVALPG